MSVVFIKCQIILVETAFTEADQHRIYIAIDTQCLVFVCASRAESNEIFKIDAHLHQNTSNGLRPVVVVYFWWIMSEVLCARCRKFIYCVRTRFGTWTFSDWGHAVHNLNDGRAFLKYANRSYFKFEWETEWKIEQKNYFISIWFLNGIAFGIFPFGR